MQHDVREHNLTGGARLLTIQIPNTITYYWSSTVRAGYRFVPTGQYELPHLAEHLAFEGTKTWPDQLAFKVEIERDGTYYNATTSFDAVSYLFSGSRDELKRIIPINLSQIYEPLYRAEEVAQQQRVVEQEMSRKQEEDAWRVWYLGLEAVLPGHNPNIAQRIANISKVTPQQLLAYHQRCYGVANTDFVLAGDYSDADIAEVKRALEAGLAHRSVGERLELKPGRFVSPAGRVLTFAPFKQSQSQFLLRFALRGRDEEHYAALQVISVMLTGGLSARLLRKARAAGLTYGLHASAGTNPDATSFVISSQTDIAKLELLVELVMTELSAVGAGEYSDDELERAIGFSVGNLRRANQTPAQYANWYRDRFAADEELESPEQRATKIAAVDRVAVAAAYKRYMQTEHGILTLIGSGLGKRAAHYRKLLQNFH